MIIAWWDKERPHLIELADYDSIPWLSANWVEWSPASEEEIEMYNKGIKHYVIGVKNG